LFDEYDDTGAATIFNKWACAHGDEPMANATVSLQPGSLQKLTTDNGFFRFTKLNPGDYHIKVTVIGYQDYEKDIRVYNDISLDIKPGTIVRNYAH
jgi:hypothetical protein